MSHYLPSRSTSFIDELLRSFHHPVFEDNLEELDLFIHTGPDTSHFYRNVRYTPLSTIRQMALRIEHLHTTINSPNGILGPASPSGDGFPTSPLIKASPEFSAAEHWLPTSSKHPLASSIHHNECQAIFVKPYIDAVLGQRF